MVCYDKNEFLVLVHKWICLDFKSGQWGHLELPQMEKMNHNLCTDLPSSMCRDI